ncbi:MAG: hypothetical protein ACRDH7_05635 [Actinomycetota bacterium]
MIVQEGSVDTQATWQRIRRWHQATGLLGLLSWLIAIPAWLVTEGMPGLPIPGAIVRRGPRPANCWPAGLALHTLTGWPKDLQPDLEQSFLARWRGWGALAQGITWVGDGPSLIWAPSRAWQDAGARGFAFAVDLIDVDVTTVSRRSTGLVAWERSGARAWLLLSRGDADALTDVLRTSGASAD